MLKKNKKITIAVLIGLLLLLLIVKVSCKKDDSAQTLQEITPVYGLIQSIVSTTGTVEPQNRLELKPPIAGRVEEILVVEGEDVKKGQILALMSSTERVALLDAAKIKGNAELKYWQDVYHATPLVAPIDGMVIVRSVEPGQTVVTSDPVLVLSDRLIVKAQVDEVDIGRIALGQKAEIHLDAYPQVVAEATVDHISYESELVNNVTIYEVDILPLTIPSVFRSGMSSTVDCVEKENDHALLIPRQAVTTQNKEDFVLVLNKKNKKQENRKITIGISNGDVVEVTQGLTSNDVVLVKVKEGVLLQSKSKGSSPFMPNFDKKKTSTK